MRPISSGSLALTSRRGFTAPSTGSGSSTPSTGSGSPAPSTGSGSTSLLSRVTLHQNHQFNRIQKGISNGTLTPEEATGLAQKQASIAQAEIQALSDGKLDKAEFQQLRTMQREASRDIFEQKHNESEQPVAESDRPSHIESFQNNQRTRLQNGLADGSLSASEASGVMDQQNRIAEMKGSALADGKMDETEYNQLRQLQREADVSIFRARHNDGIKG